MMETRIVLFCIGNYSGYVQYIFIISQKNRKTKLNTSLIYTVHANSCDKQTDIFYIIRYQLYNQ